MTKRYWSPARLLENGLTGRLGTSSEDQRPLLLCAWRILVVVSSINKQFCEVFKRILIAVFKVRVSFISDSFYFDLLCKFFSIPSIDKPFHGF